MTECFHIVTLGCKVNQYESHALREAWENAGAVETATPANAAVILVHSCAVTANAVADVRATVRRLHRAAPKALILVAGCAAQVFPEQMAALDGVSAVIPQMFKEHLKDMFTDPEKALGWNFDRKKAGCAPQIQAARFKTGCPKAALPVAAPGENRPWPDFSISGYDRARPVVKVQDGCDHRCTYCIVPYARGASVSRPAEEAGAEVERLLRAGYRECIISGVNLRQYGRDLSPPLDFWDMLDALERRFVPEWSGRARFRLSSLEPGQLNERALAFLASSRMVCPHLHISLQSGSRSVLKRMGRGHYAPESLFAFMTELARIWPCFALGADILTGFPGETEAEFEETCRICERLPLTYAHVFPFSARPKTPAALMPGQVPKEVRTFRAGVLRDMTQRKEEAFFRRLLTMPCLDMAVERLDRETGRARGACQFYVDCSVDCRAMRTAAHELLKVRPVGLEPGLIVGEPVALESDAKK